MKIEARYRCFQFLVQVILKLYFRSTEAYGEQFIPRKGRTLFIANHQAALADGLLILATNNQVIRTLVKHTLWKNKVIAFFCTGLGMIPVYRKQDLSEEERTQPSKSNEGAFLAAEEVFDRGENLLIFPEGISHDNPHLMRFRSGGTRIILNYAAKHDFSDKIHWLPVSIDVENKERSGFRALLHYHPPRNLSAYREIYNRNPEEAVAKLTEEMQQSLNKITINFPSWEMRAFIERLCEIWLAAAPASDRLVGRYNLLLKWKRIIDRAGNSPESTRDWDLLRLRVNDLHERLELAGISCAEVFERNSAGKKRRTAKYFPILVLWVPLALIGKFIWYIPNSVIQFVVHIGAGPSRDVISTYHIVAAIVLFPLWLAILFVAAQILSNTFIATGVVALAIGCGLLLASAARTLKTKWISLINMYRYSNLEVFLDTAEEEIRALCSLAASLWNRALPNQDLIDLEGRLDWKTSDSNNEGVMEKTRLRLLPKSPKEPKNPKQKIN